MAVVFPKYQIRLLFSCSVIEKNDWRQKTIASGFSSSSSFGSAFFDRRKSRNSFIIYLVEAYNSTELRVLFQKSNHFSFSFSLWFSVVSEENVGRRRTKSVEEITEEKIEIRGGPTHSLCSNLIRTKEKKNFQRIALAD